MATTEELLQTILQSLEKVEYIKSEDIPNIDLYMDQVLTFMDRKLRSAVRPQTEDRVLTKTMIKKRSASSSGEEEIFQGTCSDAHFHLLL